MSLRSRFLKSVASPSARSTLLEKAFLALRVFLFTTLAAPCVSVGRTSPHLGLSRGSCCPTLDASEASEARGEESFPVVESSEDASTGVGGEVGEGGVGEDIVGREVQ